MTPGFGQVKKRCRPGRAAARPGRLEFLLVITVIGEAIVDLVVSPDWGCHATPGGAPANVALALRGRDVSLRARLSGDGFGSMMRDHLTRNGISPRDFVAAPEQSTLAIA